MTRILFPSSPLTRKEPDPDFEAEVAAARSCGFDVELLDSEVLFSGEACSGAVRGVEEGGGQEVVLYRGWMLRPARYAELCAALSERGLTLINSPEQYRRCHYLPESYDVIAEHTVKTTWLKCGLDVDMAEVRKAVEPFEDRPIVIKDFVKSQKHYWAEACFVPSAEDTEALERVVKRFLELQDESLNEGLVFREYVELVPLAEHSKSGMPLSLEYRTFYVDKKPVYTARYWEEGEYPQAREEETFAEVAARVDSRFFTMDVARKKDGDWMIVELGDGQVSGLPPSEEPEAFYRALSGEVAERE